MRRLGLPTLLVAVSFSLTGCQALLDLFSSDVIIEASCVGDDTVVIAGRDLCAEYEKNGKIDCDVGYKIRLSGETVCP